MSIFLAPMILSFLMWEESPKDKDGFTQAARIAEEMQSWGFASRQTDGKLRRLTNRRLIESTERITFEESEAGLIGDIPFAFRATSIGVYHIKRWAGIFAYLDAMVFDTPIFRENYMEKIVEDVEEFAIAIRFNRAEVFRDYLSSVWFSANLSPSYFDWTVTVARGKENFDRVRRVIEKDARAREPRRRRRVDR